MAVKKGLGKGLDSLITTKVEKPVETNVNVENANGAILMNINKVEPNYLRREIHNESRLRHSRQT